MECPFITIEASTFPTRRGRFLTMVSIDLRPRHFDLLRHSQTGSTHLYLVRHGQTSANVLHQLAGHTDVPLDESGLRQAQQVAAHLESAPLTDIIASPLIRARVTAEHIAAYHDRPVHLDPRLREIHFGHAEGMTMAEAVRSFPELAILADDPDNEEFAWPGGQSPAAFHKSVLSTFTDLTLRHLDRHVAVVCHGGVIGSFIAQLDGGSPNDYAAYPIANCSVTHLEVHAEGTTAHRYNDVAHLEAVTTTFRSFADQVTHLQKDQG